MFPIRAVGHLRGPSPEQVTEYAAKHGLKLTPAEAEKMAEGVAASLLAMDRVDELDEPTIELRHTTRDPGRAPRGGEDPFNAVVRFCEVKGAADGPLAGRTVGVKDCIAVAGVPMTNGGRRHADCRCRPRTRSWSSACSTRGRRSRRRPTWRTWRSGSARAPRTGRPATRSTRASRPAASSSGLRRGGRGGRSCDIALGADEGGSVRIPAVVVRPGRDEGDPRPRPLATG